MTDAALIEDLAARIAALPRPAFVGLAGAQGSGKSTMAAKLGARLPNAVVLSIDDFYLTRDERRELAQTVHPLLATRGVPGTHDLALMTATIDSLLAGRPTRLPRFDKTTDDRSPKWRIHDGAVDVVMLEGWCIGAEPSEEVGEPINALERDEDPDGTWRRFANDALAAYQPLFARMDLRIFLRAPSFDIVALWRAEQEAGLKRSSRSQLPMDAAAIARFVAHYERISRAMIERPNADVIIDLDGERRVRAMSSNTVTPT